MYCPKCGSVVQDGAQTCPNCGVPMVGYVPPVQPYDHTAEFDPQDISDNKVLAMVCYLMGTLGIIIALLGSHSSKYAAFHARQCLKIAVIETLIIIVGVLLCWTGIALVLAVIAYLAVFVIRIICFISICNGKAVEPPIIRSIRFLS